jgi:glycosyltransferase involved in cell wall biosynthesis
MDTLRAGSDAMKFLFHFPFELPAGASVEDILLGRVASSGTVASVRLSIALAELGHDCTILAEQRSGRAAGVNIETIDGTSGDLSKRFEAAGAEATLVLPPASAMPALRAVRSRTAAGSVVFWLHNNLAIDLLDEAFAIGLDRVVCPSRPAAATYDAYPWWSRIEAIPYAMREEFPAAVSIPVRERVAFIGALNESKGFHHLLAAWPVVLEQMPDAILDVFGSLALHQPSARTGATGVMAAEFEDRHWRPFVSRVGEKRASQIRFRGSIKRRELIDELLHTRVVVVNPNLSGSTETFCLSALEAEACGVPVVGAAADGLLETVADGRSGLLIRTQEPRELSDAIVRLLRDDELWKTLSAGAREHAVQYGSPQVEAERWVAAVERIRTARPALRSRSRSGLLRGLTGLGRIKLALKRTLSPHPDLRRQRAVKYSRMR